MKKGQLYGLNTPVELLRFSPLSLIDRFRVGFTGLWGSICSSQGLDDVTCVEWLSRLSGKRAFETFWKPMLQAKFGDRYHEVPALWFWTPFNREKGGNKKECKGYIHGGYRRIVDTLANFIQAQGGTIKLETAIEKLDLNEKEQLVVHTSQSETNIFDRIVITTPIAFLGKALTNNKLAERCPKIDNNPAHDVAGRSGGRGDEKGQRGEKRKDAEKSVTQKHRTHQGLREGEEFRKRPEVQGNQLSTDIYSLLL